MLRDKKKVVFILVIALVIIGLMIIINFLQESNIPSVKEKYINFTNNSISKIYLIDSSAKYGIYKNNIIDTRTTNATFTDYIVNRGDNCVIINGSIRNDYNKKYFPSLVAQLYNTTGEKVGIIVMPATNYIWYKQYDQVWIDANDTTNFSIYIKYDKKDIKSYDVILLNLQDHPAP